MSETLLFGCVFSTWDLVQMQSVTQQLWVGLSPHLQQTLGCCWHCWSMHPTLSSKDRQLIEFGPSGPRDWLLGPSVTSPGIRRKPWD